MKSARSEEAIEPLALRMKHAERISGLSLSALYRYARTGDLEIIKAGSSSLVTMASLKSLLERLPRK
jgi:hypothetical protein